MQTEFQYFGNKPPIPGSDIANQAITANKESDDPWTVVASATSTDIGAVDSRNLLITGTTTIEDFGTAPAGRFRRVRFAGALTLKYDATKMVLQGGADITTAANDEAEVVSLGSGNWILFGYSRQSGQALVAHGNLLRINKVTAAGAGTYTIGSDANSFIFVPLGAGGGAGNAIGGASVQPSGQGAAGGGSGIKFMTRAQILALYPTGVIPVKVGNGGAGAAAAATLATGADGETTEIGTGGNICSATGGKGGSGIGGAANAFGAGLGYECLGGIGVNCDINIRGNPGTTLKQLSASTSPDARSNPGGAGAAPFGGPGAIALVTNTQTAGNNGDANSGGGGSSGICTYNSAASQAAGGNGGSGMIVIFEYA